MKNGKPSKGIGSDVIWEYGVMSILNRVVREVFSEMLIFEQNLNNNTKQQWHF